jgi:protein-disulfide isomerase
MKTIQLSRSCSVLGIIVALVTLSGAATESGSRAAPVPPTAEPTTIIEYADFACAFCADQAPSLEKIRREFPDVVIIFKNFPSTSHANSLAAHRAALAAAAQGKFWEMYDLLFSRKGDLVHEDFDEDARSLHLHIHPFQECMRSASTITAIERDVAEGKKLGSPGTPTLFINGREKQGVQSYDGIRAGILSRRN